MKINANTIIEQRSKKAWSQQHLADVSGLSLRTIQRIESSGNASQDSVKAIAMAFALVPADLVFTEEASSAPTTESKNIRMSILGSTLFIGLGLTIWVLIGAPANISVANPTAASQLKNSSATEQELEQAVLMWLELVDKGHYSQAWQQSDVVVQNQLAFEQWVKPVQSIRKQLGNLKQRELSSIQQHSSLPGMPNGNYAIVVFTTVFTNKQNTTERVIMSKASGEWLSIGYFLA